MVVLDTCALIELCLETPSLSDSCLRKIEDSCLILSISFAEISLKIKQAKLTLGMTAEELYEQYQSIPSVSILAIGPVEWFDSINLPWAHKDPADRLIVSYAQRHQYPIVTTDKKIKDHYRQVIW